MGGGGKGSGYRYRLTRPVLIVCVHDIVHFCRLPQSLWAVEYKTRRLIETLTMGRSPTGGIMVRSVIVLNNTTHAPVN